MIDETVTSSYFNIEIKIKDKNADVDEEDSKQGLDSKRHHNISIRPLTRLNEFASVNGLELPYTSKIEGIRKSWF